MLRSRRLWFGLLITAVFVALFLRETDFGKIRESFASARYGIAFASLPVYFLGIWMRTLRWQYLLRPIVRTSVWRLYPVVIVGLMANNLIPARAGEVVRAWVLGERERISKASSLGTIAVDRLFDGLTLVPMMLIVIPFVDQSEEFPLPVVDWTVNLVQLALFMGVIFGAALGVFFVLAFSQGWRDRIDRWVLAATPSALRPKVDGLTHSFFAGLHALRSPVDLAVAWLMSTASWLLEATMYYIVGIAFGIDAGFHVFLLATAAANLAISVLASQGGIGPFELVTKQIFIAAGVASGTATAYAIGVHALVLLPVIALGLYFLGTMGLSLGELFRRSTEAPAPATVHPALSQEEVPGS